MWFVGSLVDHVVRNPMVSASGLSVLEIHSIQQGPLGCRESALHNMVNGNIRYLGVIPDAESAGVSQMAISVVKRLDGRRVSPRPSC